MILRGVALLAIAFPGVLAASYAGAGMQASTMTRVQDAPEGFDATRAWEHLEQIVAIGPRPAGSAASRQARAYITRQLAGMGLSVQEQPFTVATPIGTVEMVNLIVRLPGRQTDRILFAGHYDTKLMRGEPFVGANDGGSSAAFLIELARVLATRPGEFTYELIWLDGEEAFCAGWTDCRSSQGPDNTYGSRHYVAAAESAGVLQSLRALILVDMIAERDPQFRRDSNSTPWLVDQVWKTASALGHDRVFVDRRFTVEDDHLPFLRAGVPALDIIDLDYPAWHTPGDTIDRLAPDGLQIVGDVVLAALPAVERDLLDRSP